MAARGRKPKPTALKLLEGNPGKRPLNGHEPVPPKDDVKCPAWLLPEAKAAWERIAPTLTAMGLLTFWDTGTLAGYCQSYAHWKEARENISKHGAKTQCGYGKLRPNPYVTIEKQNYLIMKSICREFGLKHSTLLHLIGSSDDAEGASQDSPMEKLLRGGWRNGD